MQQFVTNQMSECVVHVLELIEVDREYGVLAVGLAGEVLQMIEQSSAVSEVCRFVRIDLGSHLGLSSPSTAVSLSRAAPILIGGGNL